MVKLAVMWCPYCGVANPHSEDVPQGYGGEDAVLVWCMACGEQYVIARNTEDDGPDDNANHGI